MKDGKAMDTCKEIYKIDKGWVNQKRHAGHTNHEWQRRKKARRAVYNGRGVSTSAEWSLVLLSVTEHVPTTQKKCIRKVNRIE